LRCNCQFRIRGRWKACAFTHGLIDKLNHFFDFCGSCDALEIFAHYLLANGGMTGEQSNIQWTRDLFLAP